MQKSATFAFLRSCRRFYRTEDSVIFVSRAAKSYKEINDSVKSHSKVHTPLNNNVDEAGNPIPREPIPQVYDAEGAWNYVMKNPIDTPLDSKVPANPKTGEVSGYAGLPEPTRFGDWEKGGVCYDF
eukprot:TRINITY_DN718_c0_g1_i1.p1 TRINITY_DN718_c0_g1~~TRINITY_DN718_c0_g1_i1.p1  ORF type:complete len:126 (-),score=23.13 TRINITY_DN718_c0_g1_i1:24-401(-)